MSFRALAARTVRWRPLDGEGLEHAELFPAEGRLHLRGMVIGGVGERAQAAEYALELDDCWRTRRVELRTLDGRGLTLRADGEGRWTDGADRPLPDLDGCLDLDLAISPASNTLPIRRDPPGEGASCAYRMAYVPADLSAPFADGQVYTRLGPRRFRYAAADGAFEAELSVDDDGLVVDYPPLFRQVGA